LGTAEFVYNNKVNTSTKVSPFRANSGRDPRMGFELRKKGKNEGAEAFAKRMKEVQEEVQAALKRSQEETKKYTDRKRSEAEEYQVGDWVLLSTKDLKFQMVGRQTDKLTERFIGPYKVKKVISANAIELELPSTVKIHPAVNVSRVRKYRNQVEGQRKEMPRPVVIEEEEEWEVEKILNKRKVREKEKFLVRWKGFMAEADTWEGRENLENAKEALRDFEREYGRNKEDIRQQEKEEEKETYDRGELLGRYTAKKLFGWSDKWYDNEYWSRMERNWRRWKGKKLGREYRKK